MNAHPVTFLATMLVSAGAAAAGPAPSLVITEWMYSGSTPDGGEFFELTNVGEQAVDLTGWSFDDSGRDPGAFDLSTLGIVAPGESVVVTEDPEGAFRTQWSLGPAVRILGELGMVTGSNLGRNDELNIYDASGTLIDRLTYGDEDFPGSVRTQRVSGNPAVASALGSNDVSLWVAAETGDAQKSRVNASGDVGSPGSFREPGDGVVPGPVTVSHASGFYTGPIQIELSSDSAPIYYTTDGSLPTLESRRYEGPVAVDDRTAEPNYFSLIQTAPDESWNVPSGNVFKATAFRAAAINDDGVSGPVETRTFAVHPQGPSRFTLPLVSIVTDEPNFFGYFTGIYVPGAIYDKLYDPDIAPWNREANYTQRGDKWERPARIEFFEPDGTPGFVSDVGVRIHGGSTRSNRRKSLRVYFRSEYGLSSLEYPLFPGAAVSQFKRLIIRNGGNDAGRTLFRDAFVQDLVKHSGVDVQHSRPAIVLVNGEYWGIHNIRQRYDKHFIGFNHPEIDPENIDYLTGNLPEIEEGDDAHFLETFSYVVDNDMADAKHYREAESRIDIENFITYTAIQLYIGNSDWPENNIDYWRPRTLEGRWRWLIFDTDLSTFATDNHGWAVDAVNRLLNQSNARHARLFQCLAANPAFRIEFLNRSADLINHEFSAPRATARLEEFRVAYEPEIAEHIRRWRVPNSLLDWNVDLVVRLRSYFIGRPSHHRSHLAQAFGVPGTATLNLVNPHPERGSLRVSTIDLPADTGQWSGVYFLGVPVPLRGEAAPGFRFAGFSELAAGPEGGVVEWNPSGNATLTARFVCQADFDADGSLTFFDVSAFLNAYGASDPDADLSAPLGVFNFFDVAAFVQAFSAGCP
jgi:hypothetical protein